MTTEVLIKNVNGPENIVVQVVDEGNIEGPWTELAPGQEVKEYLYDNKTLLIWEGNIQ